MSAWTHLLCEACWNKQSPNRVPVRVLEEDQPGEPCCACGTRTASGIYFRADPSTQCAGAGVVHAEAS